VNSYWRYVLCAIACTILGSASAQIDKVRVSPLVVDNSRGNGMVKVEILAQSPRGQLPAQARIRVHNQMAYFADVKFQFEAGRENISATGYWGKQNIILPNDYQDFDLTLTHEKQRLVVSLWYPQNWLCLGLNVVEIVMTAAGCYGGVAAVVTDPKGLCEVVAGLPRLEKFSRHMRDGELRHATEDFVEIIAGLPTMLEASGAIRPEAVAKVRAFAAMSAVKRVLAIRKGLRILYDFFKLVAYGKHGILRWNDKHSGYPNYAELSYRCHSSTFNPLACQATPMVGTPPLRVEFTAQPNRIHETVLGPLSDFTWTFPDGTTRKGRSVTHVLREEGGATVQLSARDEFNTEYVAWINVMVCEHGGRSSEAEASQNKWPFDPILVIDRSGSIMNVEGLMGQIERDAETFVRELLTRTRRVAVINFSDAHNVHFDGSFSNDSDRLLRAITQPSVQEGATALLDAVKRALDIAPQGGKTALIVFSDGCENDSREKIGDVIQVAQTRGIPVLAVGYIGEQSHGKMDRNEELLRSMAENTGAMYVRAENLRVADILSRFGDYLHRKDEIAVPVF